MSSLDIITVIAIILFARLGIRLYKLHKKYKAEKEEEFWGVASGLGKKSRDVLKGKPIKYYLDLWDQVRKETLEGLKTKDDVWFAANIDEGINNHWVWFHVMEHSANHMGQIALVKNRLSK